METGIYGRQMVRALNCIEEYPFGRKDVEKHSIINREQMLNVAMLGGFKDSFAKLEEQLREEGKVYFPGFSFPLSVWE